jgi:thiol-disulfide isomerase/thioredoxin
MNRRTLLTALPVLALAPTLLRAAPTAYAPGLAEAAMDEGRTVVLDFWASWCSTCARQERVLAELKAANPAYEAAIDFFVVDWDQYGDGELSRALAIPRRSTLVALKGRTELARIVAGTGTDEIRALLDTALAAATA